MSASVISTIFIIINKPLDIQAAKNGMLVVGCGTSVKNKGSQGGIAMQGTTSSTDKQYYRYHTADVVADLQRKRRWPWATRTVMQMRDSKPRLMVPAAPPAGCHPLSKMSRNSGSLA